MSLDTNLVRWILCRYTCLGTEKYLYFSCCKLTSFVTDKKKWSIYSVEFCIWNRYKKLKFSSFVFVLQQQLAASLLTSVIFKIQFFQQFFYFPSSLTLSHYYSWSPLHCYFWPVYTLEKKINQHLLSWDDLEKSKCSCVLYSLSLSLYQLCYCFCNILTIERRGSVFRRQSLIFMFK